MQPTRRLSAASYSPLAVSFAIHATIAAFGITGAWIASHLPPPAPPPVEFKIVEAPAKTPSQPFATAKPKAEAAPPPKRAVFGVNRKSLTTEGAAVAIKKGNTLAKPPDDETLKDDDPDALPTPVEEFLVSSMPTLASEVRIPYPPEARKRGIQGPVVMDVLIDGEGRVRDAKLLAGPGAGLDEAALEAVKGFRFKPALVDGKAVAVRIRYAYRFVLER